jgi:hypothetical protein
VTALLIILVAPIIIGAHLVTNDWELAILIGMLFYPALLVAVGIAFGVAEKVYDGIQRRRYERNRRERELARLKAEANRLTHERNR